MTARLFGARGQQIMDLALFLRSAEVRYALAVAVRTTFQIGKLERRKGGIARQSLIARAGFYFPK